MGLKDCFENVEAALLDSEGDPKDEVRAALRAVAKFAFEECELPLDAFAAMAEEEFLCVEQGV